MGKTMTGLTNDEAVLTAQMDEKQVCDSTVADLKVPNLLSLWLLYSSSEEAGHTQ